ncbi:MAG TPA: acyl-CoA dehydrogenase family protein [Terriglobales bacterium]|nr:acyl-CoA dehydrogenase family protein [Terriglobales bacterium]
MVTTESPAFRPPAGREGDERFVPLAAELGARFGPTAASHDRENRFVGEHYAALRESGYTVLPIPEELGGLGASLRQICFAEAELARHCAATSLAIAMHLHPLASTVFRWRRGAPGAEALLRRVADERLIVCSSGASDFTHPSGTAEPNDGGYVVSGRKVFCSQAPAGDLLSTAAVLDGEVLVFFAPMRDPGVTVLDTWDALGMRATASHDVVLEGVRVPEAQVFARRPLGKLDPTLRANYLHAIPIITAVYLGIAAAARDEGVRLALGRDRAGDRLVQRQVGEMDVRLRTGWWSLLGALDEFRDEPSAEAMNAVWTAKHHATLGAGEVVDRAMELAGGASFYRRSPLERAYRDVRAGKYHPLTPELTLVYAGRLGLGLPGDEV